MRVVFLHLFYKKVTGKCIVDINPLWFYYVSVFDFTS